MERQVPYEEFSPQKRALLESPEIKNRIYTWIEEGDDGVYSEQAAKDFCDYLSRRPVKIGETGLMYHALDETYVSKSGKTLSKHGKFISRENADLAYRNGGETIDTILGKPNEAFGSPKSGYQVKSKFRPADPEQPESENIQFQEEDITELNHLREEVLAQLKSYAKTGDKVGFYTAADAYLIHAKGMTKPEHITEQNRTALIDGEVMKVILAGEKAMEIVDERKSTSTVQVPEVWDEKQFKPLDLDIAERLEKQLKGAYGAGDTRLFDYSKKELTDQINDMAHGEGVDPVHGQLLLADLESLLRSFDERGAVEAQSVDSGEASESVAETVDAESEGNQIEAQTLTAEETSEESATGDGSTGGDVIPAGSFIDEDPAKTGWSDGDSPDLLFDLDEPDDNEVPQTTEVSEHLSELSPDHRAAIAAAAVIAGRDTELATDADAADDDDFWSFFDEPVEPYTDTDADTPPAPDATGLPGIVDADNKPIDSHEAAPEPANLPEPKDPVDSIVVPLPVQPATANTSTDPIIDEAEKAKLRDEALKAVELDPDLQKALDLARERLVLASVAGRSAGFKNRRELSRAKAAYEVALRRAGEYVAKQMKKIDGVGDEDIEFFSKIGASEQIGLLVNGDKALGIEGIKTLQIENAERKDLRGFYDKWARWGGKGNHKGKVYKMLALGAITALPGAGLAVVGAAVLGPAVGGVAGGLMAKGIGKNLFRGFIDKNAGAKRVAELQADKVTALGLEFINNAEGKISAQSVVNIVHSQTESIRSRNRRRMIGAVAIGAVSATAGGALTNWLVDRAPDVISGGRLFVEKRLFGGRRVNGSVSLEDSHQPTGGSVDSVVPSSVPREVAVPSSVPQESVVPSSIPQEPVPSTVPEVPQPATPPMATIETTVPQEVTSTTTTPPTTTPQTTVSPSTTELPTTTIAPTTTAVVTPADVIDQAPAPTTPAPSTPAIVTAADVIDQTPVPTPPNVVTAEDVIAATSGTPAPTTEAVIIPFPPVEVVPSVPEIQLPSGFEANLPWTNAADIFGSPNPNELIQHTLDQYNQQYNHSFVWNHSDGQFWEGGRIINPSELAEYNRVMAELYQQSLETLPTAA